MTSHSAPARSRLAGRFSLRPPSVNLRSLITRLDGLAAAWLGYAFPGAANIIADFDWSPDSPGGYCPTCGDIVGQGEVTNLRASRATCSACRTRNLPYHRFVRLGPYTDPLRQWILSIKYQQWAEMARELGLMLGRAMQRSIPLPADHTVIVPMPMPWQRRLYRGIDHADAIAAGIASAVHAPVHRLLATRNGHPQVALPATQRLASPQRRIRLTHAARRIDLSGMTAVLVDDVRTTGASLNAAAKLIRTAGASQIIAAVLAVSDGTARRIRSTDDAASSSADGR